MGAAPPATRERSVVSTLTAASHSGTPEHRGPHVPVSGVVALLLAGPLGRREGFLLPPHLPFLQLCWPESLTQSVQVMRPAGGAPLPQLSHLWRLFSPLTLAVQRQPEGGQPRAARAPPLRGPVSPAPTSRWLLPVHRLLLPVHRLPRRPAAAHPAGRPRWPPQSLPRVPLGSPASPSFIPWTRRSRSLRWTRVPLAQLPAPRLDP